MTKKAEIKKIVLDLGNKEVELTIDQAKKFHELLDDMFGTKTTIVERPIHIDRYIPYWQYPYQTWCSSDNSFSAKYDNESSTLCLSANDQPT